MFTKLPNDPVILLSIVNTKLRDFYQNLDELCADMQVSKDMILEKLKEIDYEYDNTKNQFV